MKTILLWVILITSFVFLPSCSTNSNESDRQTQVGYYNICIVLDGTDRLAEQNWVPCISSDEIQYFAKRVADFGKGTLYVTYVDKDCDNNQFALFEWDEECPDTAIVKHDYDVIKEYKKKKADACLSFQNYKNRMDESICEFTNDCQKIESLAYSDLVAKQKEGSDVNGAINRAVKLLRASEYEDKPSYIILISDGCDNVGKALLDIPQNYELLVVNSNITNHQYEGLISKEFVTLGQASRYIFPKVI